MEKKILINYVKNYLKEKGFDISRRGFYGPLCLYERDDIFFAVWIDRSSYSDDQYLGFCFKIKDLCESKFDKENGNTYSMYIPLRLAWFRPENYTEKKLQKELDVIYKKSIGPIVDSGLDFICAQKDFMNGTYRKEALDYLNNYKKKQKH